MTQKQAISLSIQTFEKIIEEQRIYVDKTDIIYNLIQSDITACFLSRPRRFGKSLTISTLDAIFSGKKQLFNDLAIGKSDYTWPIHPVIRLDMKVATQANVEDAKTGLARALTEIAHTHQLSFSSTLIEDQFRELIIHLYQKTGQKVVVLIDEYDKPLIDNLDNIDEALKIQGLLKRFYGVLKSADEYLRFIFITGVSKFTKISVFSDLNQLVELTFDPNYATLVGLTENELITYYTPYIQAIAEEKNWSEEHVLNEIRRWYNGYRFSKKDITVYNPWSTLNLFQTLDFKEHWYSTGVPKLFIDMINKNQDDFSRLNPSDFDLTDVYSLSQFDTYEITTLQLIPLMVQTGFLTIKDVIDIPGQLSLFKLGYPNNEVKNAFVRMILDGRLTTGSGKRSLTVHHIQQAVSNGNIDDVIPLLNGLIASIPGILHTPKESYYHSLIQMIFQTSGLTLRSEEWVASGRMDTVIEEPNTIYIFEFKFGASAQEAITQIKAKHYAQKYHHTGKEVVAVGVSVDCKAKAIGEWLMESLKTPSVPLDR